MKNVNPFKNQKELQEFCNNKGIDYMGIFGSYARGEARNDSDIDFLISFNKSERIGLFRLSQIQEELQERLGRPVDLVTRLDKHIAPLINSDLVELYRA